MSRDPIGFDGGDWNIYRYVEDNPVILIDASGESCDLGDPILTVHPTNSFKCEPIDNACCSSLCSQKKGSILDSCYYALQVCEECGFPPKQCECICRNTLCSDVCPPPECVPVNYRYSSDLAAASSLNNDNRTCTPHTSSWSSEPK